MKVPTGFASPQSGTELWVIRHGESTWNADGRYQGQADVPLSDAGIEQTRRLTQRLLALQQSGITFQAIYTSDLMRAADTAQMSSETLGIPLVKDPQLREIDVGELLGLLRHEITDRYPEYIASLKSEPWLTKRPAGESMQDLFQRCEKVFQSYAQEHEGSRILVFTHGGVVRVAAGLALGSLQAAQSCSRLSVTNTSITRIFLSKEGNTLLGFNDAAHLELL